MLAPMFLPEPANEIRPERTVALPGQEGLGAPVRSAIGGEDRAAPLSHIADSDEGIIAEACKHFRVWTSRGAVIAKELRPIGQALEDGMIGLDESRRDSLRAFKPVIIGKQLDRQHVLDGGAFVIAFGLDPLKGEIAPDHQEAASVVHEVTNELQPVGPALRSDRHAVWEQKRI